MPFPDEFLPPPPWDGPPLPKLFLESFKLTPERIELIQRLNTEIRKRTRYGTREEPLPGPVSKVWVLSWSNASAEWYIAGHPIWYKYDPTHPEARFGYLHRHPTKAGDLVVLDANQLMIMERRQELLAILRWLEPLPLYAASFEAKTRGIYDPLTYLRAWAEKWLMEREE